MISSMKITEYANKTPKQNCFNEWFPFKNISYEVNNEETRNKNNKWYVIQWNWQSNPNIIFSQYLLNRELNGPILCCIKQKGEGGYCNEE